jgi:predicted nucleic acid-binding protein
MSQDSGRFIVVDANVLGHTCNPPEDIRTWKAAQILCAIETGKHVVVLDLKSQTGEETILDEYHRQRKSEIARYWLIALQTGKDRILWRYKSKIKIAALSDPDDQKYFQVAINSPHKIIVSEDSDLGTIANHQEVTSKGIAIWGFDKTLSEL